MKSRVQFGQETRFDVPIRRAIRTRAQLLQDIRLSLRALAMAERQKRNKRRIDWRNSSGNSETHLTNRERVRWV